MSNSREQAIPMQNGQFGSLEVHTETLGIEEAARRLGLTPKATRRAAISGEIPAIKIGRRWLILREPFDGLLRPVKRGQHEPS